MPDQNSGVPEKKILERIYRKNAHLYETVLRKFDDHIQKLFKGSPIRISVKSRVKSFDSYYLKLLKRLGSGQTITDVRLTDILGMRLVYPFIEDLEFIKKVLAANLEIVETEDKNSDQTFREFGYRSTHLIVRIPTNTQVRFPCGEQLVCEIQLRTLLQDAWAEVEHELIYKSEFTPFDEALKRKLAALNATLTLSDIIFQEIRNYQSQLHAQLDIRRKIFLDRIQGENISRNTVQELKGTFAVNGKLDGRHMVDNGAQNDIDQYLLEALYAHNSYDFARAIELYTKIFELNPPDNIRSVIFIHRGMAYFTESGYKQALADFDRALECDPGNCRAYNYRGMVNEACGRFIEAVDDFDESIRLNPFQYDALIGRAKVCMKLNRIAEAKEDVEKAVQLYPDFQEAAALLEKLRSGSKTENSDGIAPISPAIPHMHTQTDTGGLPDDPLYRE